MTVKKLSEKDKDAVVAIYRSKSQNMTGIAAFMGVSTKTIARVLIERKEGHFKPTESEEAKRVMALLYKHKINVDQLETILNTVMVMTSIRESIETQSVRTKKSPTQHNGKQTLLPLNLPDLTLDS